MRNENGAETRFRVLVVDDHPLMRDGLRRRLAAEPRLTVCGEAATLAEARRLCRKLRPDLVVLDLDLPDGSGTQLLGSPFAAGAKVLAFADGCEDGEAALRLGAAAYVGKRAPVEEFVRAVRDVLAGRTYLTTETIERLIRGRGDAVMRPRRTSRRNRVRDFV